MGVGPCLPATKWTWHSIGEGHSLWHREGLGSERDHTGSGRHRFGQSCSQQDLRLSAAPIDSRMAGLAQRARTGNLVIYAGAGISFDSGLPSGGALAESIADRYSAYGYSVDPTLKNDLLAVADAWGGDLNSLQLLVLSCAPFTATDPTETHTALALILSEGMATVLTTNWDTCVERGAPPGETIAPIVTNHDAVQFSGTGLLKVHGCASRPSTILITSSQLDETPVWAVASVNAMLSTSTVVFVGIGDVASYVQVRIVQLLDDLPDVRHVVVVWPHAQSKWSSSAWATLVPRLEEDQKYQMDAASFTGELLRAWVASAMASLRAATATSGSALANATRSLSEGLEQQDAGEVLRWLRRSVAFIEVGKSALHNPHIENAMIALASLAEGSTFDLATDTPLKAGEAYFDLCVSPTNRPGTDMSRRAFEQVRRYRQSGALSPNDTVTVVVSGHFGPLGPKDPDLFATDLIGEGEPGDVLAPPQDQTTRVLSAHQVMNS